MKNEGWGSHYESAPLLSNQIFEKRQTNLGTGDIYVTECQFISCEVTNEGGSAIYVYESLDSTKMLIEKSLFQNCTSSGESGYGTIYFLPQGNCVLSKICAYNCSASMVSFSFVWCSEGDEYKNHVLDSSVCYCNSGGQGVLYHFFGIVVISSLNFSSNTYSDCSIGCISYSPAITGKIAFSSITKNTAELGVVVFENTNILSSSNIINNKLNQDTGGIICISSFSLEVKDSCILNNIAKYTFYGESSAKGITVNNCTLDEDIDSKINEHVTITNRVSNPFEHKLVHLSTGACEAIQYKSKEKFRNFCITQNGYYLVLRKQELILTFITTFIISFLPSNP